MTDACLDMLKRMENEEGQDLAEYGLLLGLIAVVVMVAVAAIGISLFGIFDSLSMAAAVWIGDGGG
jgi:Flp pilus assembly pilin Flp